MIQVRTKFEAPCAPQHEIYQYCGVIHLSRVKMGMSSEGPWMFRAVAYRGRSEECEVPVLDEAAGQNNLRGMCGYEGLVLWQCPSKRNRRSSGRQRITCESVKGNPIRL